MADAKVGEEALAEGAIMDRAFCQRLRETDFAAYTGRDYRTLSRRLAAMQGSQERRIALCGNVTLDQLPPFLTAFAARQDILARNLIGSFGQYFQDLDSTRLTAFAPHVIVLVLSLRQLRPHAIATFTQLSAVERQALSDGIMEEVGIWIDRAAAATSATMLVANFPQPASTALGVADTADPLGETEFYHGLNLALIKRLKACPRAQLLNVARVAARIGTSRAFDERLFHIAKSEWAEPMLVGMGEEIARHLVAATGTARKCLALDLDNTLWGGVLGEDGPNGIVVGQGEPVAEAFLAFQHRLRSLRDRGVLLAICSKNDLADVEALFRERPDLPLGFDDFSAVAASWMPKDVSLAGIAKVLDIGLDSIVFVDDNPAEIALVRRRIPDVETILLPDDPSRFVAILDEMAFFEKSTLTAEDARKAELYAQERARVASRNPAETINHYLAGLGIVASIRVAAPADLPRVHQLFTKTNQFNLTGRRYSVGDLERFLSSPGHCLLIADMRDRYGSMGTVAACLVARDGDILHIDSLLMSCRAMGRGLETALMNHVKIHAASHGCSEIRATFIPTTRNTPVEDLLPQQGFERLAAKGDAHHYAQRSAHAALMACEWIALEPVT